MSIASTSKSPVGSGFDDLLPEEEEPSNIERSGGFDGSELVLVLLVVEVASEDPI